MKYISDSSDESLVTLCADNVISTIVDAWSESKTAHIVITGGRTGLAIAKALDRALFTLIRGNSAFEGSMLHIWFSDERFTNFDDPDRNDSTLITGFGLSKSHIVFHRVSATGDLDDAAKKYASELGPRTWQAPL